MGVGRRFASIFKNALVSPETGLTLIFANIAAGDWCIAVGSSARGAKASAIRASAAIVLSYLPSFA